MPLYDPKDGVSWRLEACLDGVRLGLVARVNTDEGWADVYQRGTEETYRLTGNWSVRHPETGEVNPPLESLVQAAQAAQPQGANIPDGAASPAEDS